jgi:hypothetical protein
MARYNTVLTTATTTTTATIGSPTSGQTTTLTGTAPYTVTLSSPVLFAGQTQTFINSTGGTVTLSTPTGNIRGPGFTAAATQTIPNGAVYQLTADGTDYVIVGNEGGSLSATTGTFSANVAFNGTTIASSASHTINAIYDLTTLGYIRTNYGQAWQLISTTYTAVAGDRLMCNTAGGAFTVNLPASAARGDAVHFIDYSGTFASNNLTVNNNGNYIQRQNDTMRVSTNGAAFQLVYSGAATPGWLVAQGI